MFLKYIKRSKFFQNFVCFYIQVFYKIDIDECASNPCQNNGKCLEKSNIQLYGHNSFFPTVFSYSDAYGFYCDCSPGILCFSYNG